MLCGRRRRCTSTGSPGLTKTPHFWPAILSPPQLGLREPPTVDQIRVAHHAVLSASTLHLHRDPFSEQQAQVFSALPFPHQLDPKEPPIVDHNLITHHAVRSASTLHLQREPC